MSVLVGLAIRSSVILLAGLLLTAVLRKRAAALRHWVLAGAIAGAGAVAPLSLVLPAWRIAVPVWETQPARSADSSVAPARVRAPIPLVSEPRSADTATPDAPSRFPVLPGVWFAGFLLAAVTLVVGIARLRRIASRAVPVRDGRWPAIAARVARSYGLRRDVVLLQTDTPDLLATWGVLRPRVLLPSHARDWADDRILVVMCHELAHIRRLDWLAQITAETLKTVLWFNPLMWIACTRLRRESEQACDDEVLGCGVPAPDYAAHLLELARNCRRTVTGPLPAVPMARPSTLERRIADMLNPRLDRQALSRRAAALAAALLLCVAVPTAALRAGQAGPAPLSGSVYDASGAVLPGVEVTLEGANPVKSQAHTNASGRFEFPGIAPGRYLVTASLAGFRSLRQEIELRATPDWDRAITLTVGTLSESITVSASRMPAPPQPSQPQFAQPIRVGGNIRVPRKELDVKPVYPPSMRAAGRDGVVPIEAVIGRDGTVTTVRVVSAQIHPDFAIAAVDAVRQWRFTPTLLNGQPVEVVMTVTVAFKLDQ